MPGLEPSETSRLVQLLGEGDPDAADRLLPLVYNELRALARGVMRRERRNHTLQPTALVHEVWLRLAGSDRQPWRGRAQFLAIAARSMRQILIEHARKRMAGKRGGDWQRITLDEQVSAAPSKGTQVDLLALDAALERLKALSSRQARIVELKYFGGLTGREIAEVLGVSTTTVENNWATAKAWLFRELNPT
jgi:RNA polymerase sigma factor (TIGR02999 family)